MLAPLVTATSFPSLLFPSPHSTASITVLLSSSRLLNQSAIRSTLSPPHSQKEKEKKKKKK